MEEDYRNPCRLLQGSPPLNDLNIISIVYLVSAIRLSKIYITCITLFQIGIQK